jgi:hypothetical protein
MSMHAAAQEIRDRLRRYRGARGWVVAATDTDVFLARRHTLVATTPAYAEQELMEELNER